MRHTRNRERRAMGWNTRRDAPTSALYTTYTYYYTGYPHPFKWIATRERMLARDRPPSFSETETYSSIGETLQRRFDSLQRDNGETRLADCSCGVPVKETICIKKWLDGFSDCGLAVFRHRADLPAIGTLIQWLVLLGDWSMTLCTRLVIVNSRGDA